MAGLVFRSWRTLISCCAREGNTLFSGPVSFVGKIFELILMKIRGLGMFVGKVRAITRPGTLQVVLLFLKAVYK